MRESFSFFLSRLVRLLRGDFCRMNLGRPRVLPDQEKNGIKVHRSVKMRMDIQSLKYKPKLKIEGEAEWVH